MQHVPVGLSLIRSACPWIVNPKSVHERIPGGQELADRQSLRQPDPNFVNCRAPALKIAQIEVFSLLDRLSMVPESIEQRGADAGVHFDIAAPTTLRVGLSDVNRDS